MTLSAFADVVGVSKATISRLERGKHYPRLDLLERIATAFGKTLAQFYVDMQCAAGGAA